MLRWNLVTPRDWLRTVKSSIMIHVLFSLCRWKSPLSKFIGRSPLVQCSLTVRLSLLFCQRAPQCSTVLVPAQCVVGLPAVLRSYLPVECTISDVVFRVFLQYTRLLSRQLACSQLEMAFAFASSMSDHFCPSSVVYLLCG